MQKKIAFWSGAVLIILLVMITLDIRKVKQAELPPLPIIKVGKQALEPAFVSFSWWNGNKLKKVEDDPNPSQTYTKVDPFLDLVVSFNEKEKPDNLVIGNRDMYLLEVYPEPKKTARFPFPSYPGELSLFIEAEWKDKGKAVYRVDMEVEKKTTYQEWLSPEPDRYVLLNVVMQNSMQIIEVPPALTHKILTFANLDGPSIEQIKDSYPELEIQSLPTYLVFDQKGIVLRTDKQEEVIAFFDSVTGSSYEHLLPRKKGRLAVMGVVAEESSIGRLYNEFQEFPHLDGQHITDQPESMNEMYPELQLDQLPIFFVFAREGIVYQTTNIEDLLQFIEERRPETKN